MMLCWFAVAQLLMRCCVLVLLFHRVVGLLCSGFIVLLV